MSDSDKRARDFNLERRLTTLAAQASGHTSDGGLRNFANYRAFPGGVRIGPDWIHEAREEVADASSYLLWEIERSWDGVLAGDSEASDTYESCLRALSHVIAAWHALLPRA